MADWDVEKTNRVIEWMVVKISVNNIKLPMIIFYWYCLILRYILVNIIDCCFEVIWSVCIKKIKDPLFNRNKNSID
jgi:hypothetical protein